MAEAEFRWKSEEMGLDTSRGGSVPHRDLRGQILTKRKPQASTRGLAPIVRRVRSLRESLVIATGTEIAAEAAAGQGAERRSMVGRHEMKQQHNLQGRNRIEGRS